MNPDSERPKTVHIYTRVSTSDQSTEAQERECLLYLDEQKSSGKLATGYALATKYETGVSASIPFSERKGGGEIYRSLKRGDWIVASKLDRLFRSTRDCLNLVDDFKKKGIKLHVLDFRFGSERCITNGLNEIFVTLMGAIGQWERERIAERTKDKLRVKRTNNEYCGGKVPWDQLRKGDKLVPNPDRVSLVEQMKKWRAKSVPLREIQKRILKRGEKISVRKIARFTDSVATGMAKKRGRRWTKTSSAGGSVSAS